MANHYLITGGAGFIGSHLADRLASAGNRVTVIDDLSTGVLRNLENVTATGKLIFIHSTVSECPALRQIVRESTAIFHLAAAVGVDLVIRSPISTIRTNLDETEAILDAAGEFGVPTLIASTSEVYGKSQNTTFSEDDNLL